MHIRQLVKVWLLLLVRASTIRARAQIRISLGKTPEITRISIGFRSDCGGGWLGGEFHNMRGIERPIRLS